MEMRNERVNGLGGYAIQKWPNIEDVQANEIGFFSVWAHNEVMRTAFNVAKVP